jgi:hypothetical protein
MLGQQLLFPLKEPLPQLRQHRGIGRFVRVAVTSYRNPFDDIPRDLALPAVAEPRGARVRPGAARLLLQSGQIH